MNRFEEQLIKNLKCWAIKKETPPLLVSFRLTSGCDLSCLFCDPNIRIKSSEELKIGDYEKLLKELNQAGVKLCAIVGGGEALCKKELTLQVIKLIKKYKMVGWLVTNGVNFDKKMIRELVKIGFDSVLFSLDGPNAEIHDYLRGRNGTFDRVIKNIQSFNYWKIKLKRRKPFLKVQTLLTNKNYNQIGRMLSLIRKLKMNYLILNFLVTHKKEWEKLQLNETEEKKLKKDLKYFLNLNKANKKFTNFQDYLRIIESKNGYRKKFKRTKEDILSSYCFQSWYHLNISETGFVNFCPELNNRYGEGSVKKKNVLDLWRGRNYNKFREKILKGQMLDICAKYCNLPVFIENLKIKDLIKNKKNGLRI